MNTFKVGDKVKINLPGTWWHDRIGVLEIARPLPHLCDVLVDGYATIISVQCSELELIQENKSFIEQAINGAKVHNPVGNGVDDFVFCGYAFKGKGWGGDTIYVTDEDGNAKYHAVNFGTCDFALEPQPEKTTIHSVAFQDGLHGRKWLVVNISDETLGRSKHRWAAYKILDTWYE